jgi:ubiquinone biosynthesis protein COQ9
MGQQQDISADIILDKALELAETGSWENLHLHDIAAALDIPLDKIREYYLQKDAIAEAWFDRADHALLSWQPESAFYALPEHTRLQQVIMRWFNALGDHRRLSREMLYYKLETGHIHLQVLGIMRISRTVQWFREAARLEARSLNRIIEETVITGIYLASFGHWLYDDSPDSRKTGHFLESALVFFGGQARHSND